MTAPQMLPLDRQYRELRWSRHWWVAFVDGLGLAYLGITGVMADLVFGDSRTQVLSAERWWGGTAGGGLTVTALRQWWKVPRGCLVALPSSSRAMSTRAWFCPGWVSRRVSGSRGEP